MLDFVFMMATGEMAATGPACAAAKVALKPPWGCIAFLLRKDRTDIAD